MKIFCLSVAVFFIVPSTLFSQTTFQPSDLPGLNVWLTGDSVILNGATVQQWTDLSGNNNHAVQNSPANQPGHTAVPLLNNKLVLRFDGSNDFMNISSGLTIGTVFLVSNWRGGGNVFPAYNGIISSATAPYDWFEGELSTALLRTEASSNIVVYKNGIALPTKDYSPLADYKITSSYIPVALSYLTMIIGNDEGLQSSSWNGDMAEIIVYNHALADSDRVKVVAYLDKKYAPPVNIGPDIAMSLVCDTVLNAGSRFVSYKWNNNASDTDSVFTATHPGVYYVDVTDIFGFHSSDTVVITYPLHQLTNSAFCAGDTLVWNTNLNHSFTFLWSDNSTDSLLNITSAGQYWVSVTDSLGCNLTSDTISVSIDNFSQLATLGNDTALCAGNSIGLTVGANQVQTYLWSDNSSNATLAINTSGPYWVTVTDSAGCTKTDTIIVTISGTAPVVDFGAASLCFGESTRFSDSSTAVTGIASWLWTFGDPASGANDTSFQPNPSHIFSSTGIHQVSLTVVSNAGCFQTQSQNITIHTIPIPDFTESNVCMNNSVLFNDNSTSSPEIITNWQWNFGDILSGANNVSILQNPSHLFVATTTADFLVKLIAVNNFGCKDSVEKSIHLYPAGACFLPGQLPGLQVWVMGDSIQLNGSTVQKSIDLSGNNNHLIQNTVANEPGHAIVPLLNYKQVVRYDGVDDFMSVNSPLTIGTVIIISNWRGGGTVFPAFNGLVSCTTFPFDWLEGFIGSSQLRAEVPGNVVIYKNSSPVPTNEYGPFADYKITSSTNSTPVNYPSLLIGNDEGNVGASWNGDVAEMIIYNQALADTDRAKVETYLHYKYAPPVNIGPDVVMYTLCDTSLDASARFTSYKWHRGNDTTTISTNQVLVVTNPGKYWVETTDIFGFSSVDSVNISYPIHQLQQNNVLCFGNTLLWNTNLDTTNYDFLWNDNSGFPSLTITQAGQYYVAVTENATGCTLLSDTVAVAIDSFPLIASLGNDSVFLCTGNTIGLVQGAAQATHYLWSTNDTTAVIAINTSALYSLFVTDINGCSKTDSVYATIVGLPPVANFSAAAACFGTAIQFTDSSFDPTPGDSIVSWQWNFDDGGSDTLQNPSHLFPTPGNHLAILTVISNLGCPGTDSGIVAVHHVPVSSFTNTMPCTINAVQFTSTSSIAAGDTINSWSWNFGNPASGTNNSSLLPYPNHLFTDTGNFVVRLITTTTFGCSDTAFNVLLVKRASNANFQYSATCFGNLVQFTNLSTPALLDTAWRWDFGDGTGLNQFENPAHLYAFAQTYDVTLFVYSSTGCVSASSLPVTVSPIPLAGFVHDDICVNSPHLFIDSSSVAAGSIVRWNWSIGGIIFDTLQNALHTFPDTGNYVISHTVTTDIGCSKTVTRTVHVSPLPVVNFSFNPPFGNPPLLVSFTNLTNNLANNTYYWDFGDGDTSTAANPQHLYTDTNFFAIKLIGMNSSGCTDSSEKRIYVIRPVLDLGITGLSSSYIADNHLHIVINLANLGTRDITNYKIDAFLDDGTHIEESFVETLPTGVSKQLQLSASLDLGAGQSQYYCVHALEPNNTVDDVALNDEKCKSLSANFSVPDPYPNPFNDNLVLQMILPYKGQVSIEMFDMAGKKITIYEGIGHEGLNEFDAELGGLANGPYAVRFMFKESEIIKTILKIEKKK